MTTKEQERKALAQIMKIVEGLGNDSYIATAFDGCFEIAERNIENDWACSMKDRAETAETKLANLAKKYDDDMDRMRVCKEHLEKSRAEEQAKAASNFQEAMKLSNKVRELEDAIAQQRQDQLKATEAVDDLHEELNQKDMEIMKLKAKLFDLLVK